MGTLSFRKGRVSFPRAGENHAISKDFPHLFRPFGWGLAGFLSSPSPERGSQAVDVQTESWAVRATQVGWLRHNEYTDDPMDGEI